MGPNVDVVSSLSLHQSPLSVDHSPRSGRRTVVRRKRERFPDSTEKTTKTPRMSTSEHEENLKDKLQIIRQSEVESEFSCAKP